MTGCGPKNPIFFFFLYKKKTLSQVECGGHSCRPWQRHNPRGQFQGVSPGLLSGYSRFWRINLELRNRKNRPILKTVSSPTPAASTILASLVCCRRRTEFGFALRARQTWWTPPPPNQISLYSAICYKCDQSSLCPICHFRVSSDWSLNGRWAEPNNLHSHEIASRRNTIFVHFERSSRVIPSRCTRLRTSA